MNQLFLGAVVPLIVAGVVYILRGCRASVLFLILTPLAMMCSALWAVVPDLPRLVGLHGLYMRLANDPRMDVFYWHYTIDQIETDSRWWAVGIVLLAACLLAVALRELAATERK
jgi:hypothetical protein